MYRGIGQHVGCRFHLRIPHGSAGGLESNGRKLSRSGAFQDQHQPRVGQAERLLCESRRGTGVLCFGDPQPSISLGLLREHVVRRCTTAMAAEGKGYGEKVVGGGVQTTAQALHTRRGASDEAPKGDERAGEASSLQDLDCADRN